MGNTAHHCRLGLFQDSDFVGDHEDSKSTSGVILCIFGSRTFVPTSWTCKKQTSVSHSSTESEVISLDAGLRMDGIPALHLCDMVIEVVHSSTNVPARRNRREMRSTFQHGGTRRETRSTFQHAETRREMRFKASTLTPIPKRRNMVTERMMSCLMWATLLQAQSLLTSKRCFKFFEDTDAVIKTIIKGRSPTMRHVSRTHRVALDLLFDRINLDPQIQINYVDTKNQLADVLTKIN